MMLLTLRNLPFLPSWLPNARVSVRQMLLADVCRRPYE